MPCLDDNTVAALIEGLLSPEALSDMDAHVDACTDCRLLLSNVAPLLAPAASEVKAAPSQYTFSRTIEHDRVKWNASMRVGTVLRDKWRLERLLGVGGTAAVYEATHKTHGGRVAIKLIHGGLELDPGERRRFLREGYAANAVGHPGIVRVIDDDVDDDGSIFLVSELIEGETLHVRLGRLGRVPLDEVLMFADDVLDILAAAHERGIIHRDIKPENILAARTGETKLLDFGMALVREATYESTVTTTHGLALGTPAFMPPEQALGLTEEIGPPTDIWAVGATMFTLLSGRLVHDAQTVTDALRRTVNLPAPPLASVLPELPEDVCQLIDRALAFAKENRWSTAREMQSATRESLRRHQQVPLEGALPDLTTIAFYEPAPAPARSLRTASIFLGVAAFVGSASLGGWWMTRPAASPPATFPDPVPVAVVPEATAIAVVPAPVASAPSPTPVMEIEAATSPPPPESSMRSTKSPTHVIIKPRPPVSAAVSSAPAAPAVGSTWLDRRTR